MKVIKRYYPHKLDIFLELFSLVAILLILVTLILIETLSTELQLVLYITTPIAVLMDIFMIILYFRKPLLIGQDRIIGPFIKNIDVQNLKADRIELSLSKIESFTQMKFTKLHLHFHLVECALTTGERIFLVITPFSKSQKMEIIELLNSHIVA